ncbi:MAG: hypothetical protein HYX79_06715 [Chloroflexi bacterium]|nr:hypothetical protein [Chloroflexota bacterium]
MKNEPTSTKERVIKEYPNVTYWLDGRKIMGWGNLILTTERLIFLNRVVPEDWQTEKLQELNREGDFDKITEFALKLHKKNFQVPLASVTGVRMGVFSLIPIPKLCMRIQYQTARKKLVETGFWFRIPILKGLFQLEPPLVQGWINAVRAAVKKKQEADAT